MPDILLAHGFYVPWWLIAGAGGIVLGVLGLLGWGLWWAITKGIGMRR